MDTVIQVLVNLWMVAIGLWLGYRLGFHRGFDRGLSEGVKTVWMAVMASRPEPFNGSKTVPGEVLRKEADREEGDSSR